MIPAGVAAARELAASCGFQRSCEPPVGPLLAALAAAARPGGRILELGTGCGVGTAWLVHGLAGRDDVRLVTVEQDAGLVRDVRAAGLPDWVEVRHGEILEMLPGLGRFDLVFADAEGGKWTGLDLTVGALEPGAVLLVDDMDPARYHLPEHRAAVAAVRTGLLGDRRLTSAELPTGSGLLLSTRRHTDQ